MPHVAPSDLKELNDYITVVITVINLRSFTMGSFAKIVITAVACGVVQQIVCSISDAYRPAPKVKEPK